ncbi:hypothetical protein ABPG72_014017 [Tetrahymena utriculariae]
MIVNRRKLYQKFSAVLKVSIWGAIYQSGSLIFKIMNKNINSERQLDLLYEFFPEFLKNKRDQCYLMHDSAKPCQGKKVKEYLQQQNVEILPRASQNPDINQIERG